MKRTTIRLPKLQLRPALRGRWLACARMLFAPLLLAALLVAPSARANTLFRCNFSGVVMTSCCCPAADPPRHGAPALSRATCCKVQHVATPVSAGTVDPSKAQASAPRTLVWASKAPTAPLRLLAVCARTSANELAARFQKPARAGPPLTIAYQRFLI